MSLRAPRWELHLPRLVRRRLCVRGDEARQWDCIGRGGICIGRSGLERDFACGGGGIRRINGITDAAVGTALAAVGWKAILSARGVRQRFNFKPHVPSYHWKLRSFFKHSLNFKSLFDCCVMEARL